MSTGQRKIFSCPNCSLRVSGLESGCPRCGTAFNKDTKLECPFCGTLVLPTATSCPSCRIVYSEIQDRLEERLGDKAANKIVEELNEIAEADSDDLVCKKCNSILERPMGRCDKCGFSASNIEKKHERGSEKREPLPSEPRSDVVDVEAICPTCGLAVGLRDSVCRHCGAEFLLDDEGAEEDEAELEPDTEGAEAICPICGLAVGLRDSVCRHCGAEFLLDDEGAEEDDVEEDQPVYCPTCNKEVDLEIAKCPHCGVEFEDEEHPDPLLLAGRTRFEKAPESRAISETGVTIPNGRATGIRTSAPIRHGRGPIGLSNGTSAVNGVGIVNGESRINGMHHTNGLGATNGRVMINGTGLTRGGAAGRIRVPFDARFLAVLIAIVVVISGFAYVSFSQKGSPYEVDGDFGEWEDEVMFTMIAASPSPDTNVVEWAAATHDLQLHVYVKVEGQLMAGGSAQRLTFFVDADDRGSTGYLVGDIGADFMLQILGWNETVMASAAYEFYSTPDQLNWSRWRQIGPVLSDLSGERIEAMALLPRQLNSSSRIILVSQDSEGIRCMSHPILLGGGLLIVEQSPASEIAAADIMTPSSQGEFLQLRFSCQGVGGSVYSVTPEMIGFDTCEPIAPFSLEVDQEHRVAVVVDSSQVLPGQFVSAALKPSGISSSFQRVLIIGEGGRAYCISPPEAISIDGAFADWTNKIVKDYDDLPITNQNVNIDEVGADSSTGNSYFYVSVFGEICSGAYVPKDCAVFTSAGGGAVVPARRTAEDFARIFIDSDQSETTGNLMTIGTLSIGADFMIEIGGMGGKISSRSVHSHSSGSWEELDVPIQAAKDSSRIEIGVITSSIGDPASLDFIIETTDWRGSGDQTTNTTEYGTRQWVVDSSTTTQDATSMSYQRKLFHDGTNYWSFYFDGDDTVYKYSSDGGETWTSGATVFSASGVNEVSIWYDSDNGIVYAVGDGTTPSGNVYVQKGTVNPGLHTITWDAGDSTVAISSESIEGKNAYICRDGNGYLWVLGTNQSQSSPDRYKFTAFRSSSTNDIGGWVYSGEMLPSDGISISEIRGSIVPAGSGSDVWAVFSYDGNVYSKKYTGTWPESETEVFDAGGGSGENTIYATPSVVVDSDGVVHVVYGDNVVSGSTLIPNIFYTHNNTDSTTWVAAVNLDDSKPSNLGDRYPTISLDTSTGDLYSFWIRTTSSGVGQTIMGKKNSGGSWNSLTISNPDTYPKNHLTSIYSVSSESQICWQWTQNTTGNIEVVFDSIPEFGDLMVPLLMIMAIFYIGMRRRRAREPRKH
jgi:predicted RNA-binding Zn-ribbon protein involved in translation (DUF1610 family)